MACLTNQGLEEIARILNLHAASGILKKPKGCRDSPRLFINFEQYRISEKFNSSNPNASLIDQMQRFVIYFCGQTMVFSGSNATELYNNIFAAKVAITKYQTAGYVSFIIN
jgi:hypothetical protein